MSKVVSDMKSKRDNPKSDIKLNLYSAVRMHTYVYTVLNFGIVKIGYYICFKLLHFLHVFKPLYIHVHVSLIQGIYANPKIRGLSVVIRA